MAMKNLWSRTSFSDICLYSTLEEETEGLPITWKASLVYKVESSWLELYSKRSISREKKLTYKKKLGTKKLTQWVRALALQTWGPDSYPEHPHSWMCLWSQLGGLGGSDGWTVHENSLASCQCSFCSRNRPCVKSVTMGKKWVASCSGLCMHRFSLFHIYMPAPTHTHTKKKF